MLAKNTRLSFECPEKLADLTATADPAVRFCGACRKHVFDLSALTEAEAIAVQAARGCDGQSACIAFAVRGEEVLVQPGPPRSATRIVLALAAAGLAIPAGLALLGSDPSKAPNDAAEGQRPGAAALSLSAAGPDPDTVAADLLAESGRLARGTSRGVTASADAPCEGMEVDAAADTDTDTGTADWADALEHGRDPFAHRTAGGGSARETETVDFMGVVALPLSPGRR